MLLGRWGEFESAIFSKFDPKGCRRSLYCAGENSSLLVALDFHGDFDDWVVVRTIPKQIPIFFCEGMREYDVLPVACRPRLLCVLVCLLYTSDAADD